MKLADAMKAATSNPYVVSFNKDLHFAAYDAPNMLMLVNIIETLWLRIGPIRNYDLRSGSERTQKKIAVDHHAQMIAGLKAGDAKIA